MKIIANIFIFLILINTITNFRSNRRRLFDSIFKWESATVTVNSSASKTPFIFQANINSDREGIFFKNLKILGSDSLQFIDTATYKNVDTEMTVIDFCLMKTCKFIKNSGFLSGLAISFEMTNFAKEGSSDKQNFNVEFSYKLGSSTFGSVDGDKIVKELVSNCNARQKQIKDEIAKRKEEEKKRQIEAEILKKKQEILEQENKRKAEEEAKKLEDQKKLEEEKKKAEAAKAEEKKVAEEAVKKLQEQIKQQEEERKKNEERKKEEEAKIQEELKKEEEKKLKELEEKKNELIKQAEAESLEKKNLQILNTIKVPLNSGFGLAYYISGDDQTLGNWKTGYKLTNLGPSEWQFKSPNIKNDMIFKIILYNWVDGDTIDIASINKKDLKWESPQGKEGNKIMKFTENSMEHSPTFSKKLKKRKSKFLKK